jgi:hypothetical protein
LALSPFPLLFGATAFTDPILVVWWLAACYAALRGRWGWAGLLLGLAFASKQQAVLLSPLVLLLGLAASRRQGQNLAANVSRLAVGAGSTIALVFVWDGVRAATGDVLGFWDQSAQSFGGLRLIWSTELLDRISAWLRTSQYVFGTAWLSIAVGVALVSLFGWYLVRGPSEYALLVDVMLVLFIAFYALVHLLVAFPVWDRYLLPLVPAVGFLLAGQLGRVLTLYRGLPRAQDGHRQRRQLVVLAVALVVLLSSGFLAAAGRIPVGGDHGAYDGVEEVVHFLHHLPVGAVLYDRWLSWHYDFYLFDATLFRAGFPSPAWLAADAAAFVDAAPRYLVVPDWVSSVRIRRTLRESGLVLSPELVTHRPDGSRSFVIYRIERYVGG